MTGDQQPDDGNEERGQLVLVAAGAIAIALVPLVLAYLQLGYHADVEAGGEYDDPAGNAERLLSRAVHGAANASGDWSRRDRVVGEVRDRLDADIATLEGSRVDRGTAYAVAYNQSAAAAWAGDHCPSGPNRQFGPCEARRGVVVQRRAGETTVLAVALDVTITTENGRSDLTYVIRAIGGTR